MKTPHWILAGLAIAFVSLTALAGDTGRIEVRVQALRSDAGQVFVSLFNSEDGFPSGDQPPFRTRSAKQLNGEATVVFEDVPYGEYAVAAYHDEDGNGKMKTVYGTIPLEGIGISRDAKGVMGPPKFKDAKFELATGATVIAVQIKY